MAVDLRGELFCLNGKSKIQIDLITGFLGSGKTTFIKKYAAYFLNQGKKIGILENDFGAVNVDMMLLQDVMSDSCDVDMIAGACDKDCHRRRMKTKLIAMGMLGYDRVLIEPSGIFDVDEFFDILHEDPLERWYEIGNVIAIVDASMPAGMSKEAEYLFATQISCAGQIVFSKCQETTSERIEQTIQQMNAAMEQFGCKRRFQKEDILLKDWKTLENNDFLKMASGGYTTDRFAKLWFENEDAFSTLYFMEPTVSSDKVSEITDRIMNNSACGKVIRMKGFFKTPEGTWIELNATTENKKIEPIKEGQEVVIVIGEHLVEEEIRKYLYEEPAR